MLITTVDNFWSKDH